MTFFVYKYARISELADIYFPLAFTMLSRLPLLLILASFVLIKPCVEATRYDLADAALSVGEQSLPQVSTSQIVLIYQVVDNTPANSRFKKEIGYEHARKVLGDATGFVLTMLDQVPIRRGYLSVKLTVESFAECENVSDPLQVSSTVGSNIHLNSDYIEKFKGDMKSEFEGIVYHETANVWQWNGHGTAPKWLLSGIADYARLKSGRPSKDWPKRGSGLRWTEGYAVTAYFLQYCDHLHKGFIPELNSKMQTCYSREYFMELLGKSVNEMWKDYKRAYAAPTPAPAPAPHGP